MKGVLGRRFAAGGLLLLAAPLTAQTPPRKSAKAPRPYTPPPAFAATQPMD